MAKRCALRRRHDISLAVESQLLWGCALLELTLALWRVLRAKVCSCEDASSELVLAQGIGVEAATAPKSALLKCRSKYAR